MHETAHPLLFSTVMHGCLLTLLKSQISPEWRIAKIKKECNLVVNELARLARRNTHSAFGGVVRMCVCVR